MTEVDIDKENAKIAKAYKQLLKVSYQTLTADDKKLIRHAFEVALDAHKDQRRKSGEAYIFHPIAVARIVAGEIGLDATCIAAALLHDVVEDNPNFTIDDIERLFGETVARIVDGLTKISSLSKDTDVSTQAENFRKMLLTLNDDVRVIIIKIADRLHNMQTMDSMRRDKQEKIASETLYIYAPLAHRIGLYNIKTELEDLGLKYTEPEVYEDILEKIQESKEEQDLYIKAFSKVIEDSLEQEGLNYEIKGRPKSIFSIRRKIVKQGVDFDEVYDKFAVRIIYKSDVANEKFLAWKIYSIVTDNFTPNPTRLRDWISSPKSTGYEALHITVMGPKGRWVEVQIRSERMNEIAEKGYAAHYKYKEGDAEDALDTWIDKLQEALESNETNAVDFVEQFKLNLYSKEIYVFSPKGELKSLPKGATSLDFAFSIHTEIGMKTRGAKVNGKLAPLSHVLQSGDQVEILTSEHIKPNRNWLDYATTARARSKIKSSLKDEKKDLAEDGKEILRRKLKQLKVPLDEKSVNEMVNFFKLKTSLDLFYRVGIGSIDNKMLKEYVASRSNVFMSYIKNKIRKPTVPPDIDKDEITANYDQLVFGPDEQKLDYKLSECCNPIPGDPVFGFLTINEGIKIHKKNCPNALSLQSNYAYRIMQAKWIDSSQQEFATKIELSGIDKLGLVNTITKVISSNMHVNMKSISFETDGGIFRGKINVVVNNNSMLQKLMDNLKKINGIDKVTRV
ncbi:bifunctional (p)ppGpp synthetase/guanosine-3',5'-bis(diphosphate) 3'-pyrophosphohydrolase [Subsaximicrobium wynnwilliamsii]|uniref:Bifunctional (P)ppGpp synthetase/guanosine-3',5'-bis(Diphosphate) 3'-pyrophosphohydrolase n=1 Tax=Subsaximicrobium wynnwilliamsii TaxID=291179 RepID=A0A5C6ZN71_9FLAO|nr:RelA/SpoT family protein [Subsaximicrobium wynnwilliamsii]TXD84762.1 bifunctional (p)ppGpp synthetase/guanosine-3',5'-bis(diphosphate) 3'-pyrophosphohydrolase [Subsaximicrobium wynnwilliamsii]TXD90433.1 bifunctional (p)ppGpp synthetase/guanosine-3',5'-bis(diphosphate) 3'-pyrophosphohydrolase [Subsaximicrobium wynnwilliamsii]TXE04909.1 bifunctional (p)ppGpp synthetase/guanosine-3',5'-bis(diphosphate) 3'-pyrophosphohydrolase [Subsaximicrobium wynnwilliamsii]